MVDGSIEVLHVDAITQKATGTSPWKPTNEWEIKSIVDISSGDVLDPKTRAVVGRAIAGAVESTPSERAPMRGEAKPS
jgi:hypothetical protein